MNVEDQPSTTDASADDPPEEKEEQETMANVSSTSSYKPSDDSSTTTSLVNVVSHASRQKKQHLGQDAAKGKLQLDKERQKQTKLLSETNDTMKDSVENSSSRFYLISCSQGILNSSRLSCYLLLRLLVYMYLSQLMRTFTNYLKCIVISS